MPDRQVLALNQHARKQSASGPPTQETVTVAVLPPRLPTHLAPGQGVGTGGAGDYDGAVNWQHNAKLPQGGEATSGRKMSFLEKAGLTTYRKRRNPNVPPFVMRTVPYDVWRKHYAKDKDGNYQGTHAPAEDCLLKPEDVKKWSAVEPETVGDTWTRGREALPGYGEVKDQGSVPEYVDVTSETGKGGQPAFVERTVSDASAHVPSTQGSGRTIDGKTTAEYVADYQAKLDSKPKEGWKNKLLGK